MSNPAASGLPVRILVVDDDPDTLEIIGRHLQHEGFVAMLAASGAECLRIVADAAVGVDVILLDLMMPEMDGFEVCEALKRIPALAAVPIIVITARDDIEARAEGMRLGVSEFLPKPFSRRELVARIRVQLAARDAANAAEATLARLKSGA